MTKWSVIFTKKECDILLEAGYYYRDGATHIDDKTTGLPNNSKEKHHLSTALDKVATWRDILKKGGKQ